MPVRKRTQNTGKQQIKEGIMGKKWAKLVFENESNVLSPKFVDKLRKAKGLVRKPRRGEIF